MNAVVQKICAGCGKDVAAQKRMKDRSGRYYCHPCWNSRLPESQGGVDDKGGLTKEMSPILPPQVDVAPANSEARRPTGRGSRRPIAAIGILLLMVVACGWIAFLLQNRRNSSATATQDMTQHDGPMVELLQHPEALLDAKIHRGSYLVNGVKLGDSQTKIPASRIKSKDEFSPGKESIECFDGITYFLAGGSINTIVLPKSYCTRLPLGDQQHADSILGPPDLKAKNIVNEDEFYYSRSDLLIVWNNNEIQRVFIFSDAEMQKAEASAAQNARPAAVTARVPTKSEMIEADPLAVLLISKYPEAEGPLKLNSPALQPYLTLMISNGELAAADADHLWALARRLVLSPD